MPANRNALIRYQTIDKCLQNRYRKWTLDDLIEAVSDALYEFEGLDRPISKRTIQLDIQTMRSDKLGYLAPIIVVDRKYYTYSDPNFSIANIPLTDQDLGKLKEVVQILRQFQGFSHFEEMTGMVQRLQDKIHTAEHRQASIVQFETNPNLKGLKYLDPLYQVILNRRVIELTYRSFKAQKANAFHFHAYLLKEYRNRWFVVGRRGAKQKIQNLALDRIQQIRVLPKAEFFESPEFQADQYYDHVVGVTVEPQNREVDVTVKVDKAFTPYLLTKPLHHSQEWLEDGETYDLLKIRVIHNLELETLLISYSHALEVVAPKRLRRRIKKILTGAVGRYD
ncbi:WYL domain-containing protein [Pontibacter sp. G13]|uniref:helix-turn-helix transcriptional regulator n=1 Tax=Pontibacter sp. G13 TaxID=3074898 RepID=UPI00288AD768|nr:WYL domain-containing protein [Pontibacter sp. G13]WNJ18731.1 WYL domain-containing protein [Pontibacter sp. G13]